MIHLDNVVEPAASAETKSSQPESPGFVSPHHHPVVAVDEFWKQPSSDARPRSAENQVDDDDDEGGGGGVGYTSASHDFYNMVLNILDTFHTAAEMEVRRTRKRDFQRQAAIDLLI